MIPSLAERLKKCEKKYEADCKNEHTIEDILDTLRTTDLWKTLSQNEDNMSFSSWLWIHTLTIKSAVDVQDVEDQFCSAIHQKYGCDWRMEVQSTYIDLKSNPFEIYEDFVIRIEKTESCEIKRILRRTLTDEELAKKRNEYDYYIDCGDGEPHQLRKEEV